MPEHSRKIATRNQRYSAIAKACLAVLNHKSFSNKSKQQQIEAVYAAIDNAFNEQQELLLKDIELMQKTLNAIHDAASKNNVEVCLSLSKEYVSQ